MVIASGLLLRSHYVTLSGFIVKYGGDALWALVVFLGFGFILVHASTMRLAAMALLFSWAVEFSQLYHAPWIDTIRSTRLGGMVLGSTFNVPDLLAYAVGIGIGVSLESIWHRTRRQ